MKRLFRKTPRPGFLQPFVDVFFIHDKFIAYIAFFFNLSRGKFSHQESDGHGTQ